MQLFFISDTHFSHANILKFTDSTFGLPIRPGFASIEEMDEFIVDRWNAIVKPQDHVYHLGDVSMKKKGLQIVRRLNGHNRLIFGNHDIFGYKDYADVGFEKMMGMRVMDGIIFTHVPIHPSSMERFKFNVHGHLHNKKIKFHGISSDDHSLRDHEKYVNVSVELTGYAPVPFEAIKAGVITQ